MVMYQKVMGTITQVEHQENDGDENEEENLEAQPKTLIEYNSREFSLNAIYKAIKTYTKYCMLGGVAFLRFKLSYIYDPDVHATKQTLPVSTLLEVKIKILGFYGLSADGEEINATIYKKKALFNY